MRLLQLTVTFFSSALILEAVANAAIDPNQEYSCEVTAVNGDSGVNGPFAPKVGALTIENLSVSKLKDSGGFIGLRNPNGKSTTIFLYSPVEIFYSPSEPNGVLYLATNIKEELESQGWLRFYENSDGKMEMTVSISRTLSLARTSDGGTIINNSILISHVKYMLSCARAKK
jgi:hypothetical protein